ncbi:J protein JJJ2-like [Pecten maximus]|uniref:J protein JJJ2-like n=1 Tax=Pecten maximus TaxID=6579 RepID=UPI001458D13F|nr:J protein JJJ2-like [Pecten maximus]
MVLHFARAECQYSKLQRLCKLFAQIHVRRQQYRHALEAGQSRCQYRTVNYNSIASATSQLPKICIPSCPSSHITCRSFSRFSGKQKDYYKILDVNLNADASEVKSAYFRLSKKYHPDLNQGISTASFLDVVEAYEVLGNENKRREYDSTFFYNSSYQHPQQENVDKFYRYSHQTQKEYDDHEREHGNQNMKHPLDFQDGEEWTPKDHTVTDHVMTVVMCVLASVIAYKIFADFEDVSKNTKMNYQSDNLKKLERGALVPTVDPSKQSTASQSEKKI